MLTQACSDKIFNQDFDSLIQRCLKIEQDRNLSQNSIKELERYLTGFNQYCQTNGVCSPEDLKPDFLRNYADQRCTNSGPNLKKAVVWSLRKFGKFLKLIQVVTDDPAKSLRHPKFHPRSELPNYLSETELRNLLEYTATKRDKLDFSIISLMATTGLRPKEIASIDLNNTYLNSHYIKVQVKGGWIKQTAISVSMAAVLADYLSTRQDNASALFVNKRGNPISVAWLQRFVKELGKDAKISIPLTSNCLRHTFATHAADKHGKITTKALMGHQNLCTTEIYTHLSPRHFKVIANCHPLNLLAKKK